MTALQQDRSARLGPWVRAVLIGAALVTVLTYPTIPHAASVRAGGNDALFSIWNIAWIDHALLTSPRDLLNANIFWPHRGTLAYSELNLVAGVLGLPWYAVTRSPLAALNGAVATGLLLTFVLMAALVRRLTGSEGGGVVSAVAFTFCPYVVSRTAHVQLLMTFALPLTLLAYHRLRERPTAWRGAALGGALAVAALACGYYGIFAGCALGLVALCLARRQPWYWGALACALITAGVLVLPVYSVYESARAASGATVLTRSIEETRAWSANLSSYLASAAFAHAWWLPALRGWSQWVDVLFPGIGLLALAAVGVGAMTARAAGAFERRLLWAYLGLALAALWASFGPDAGLYRLLMSIVPGMSLLRAPARLGIVVAFALSVLAGFGVVWLSRRRRWVPAVLVVCLTAELGVRTEEWGWPSWPLRTVPPLPPAYQALARLPRGPLVEYQFPYVRANYHNHATAMFWSTYHWQPLVNGYSDLIPSDFGDIALPINSFPDPASFEIMRDRQVRYVLWHIEDYKGEGEAIITKRLDTYQQYLRPIVRTDDIWLYEITRWP